MQGQMHVHAIELGPPVPLAGHFSVRDATTAPDPDGIDGTHGMDRTHGMARTHGIDGMTV
jgi:hypothetical protein